jgi:ABC-2 type transport system permease protein
VLRRVAAIASTELKLLARNRAAATMALVMPVAIGAFLAFRPPDLGAGSARTLWIWIVTTQIVAMLGFTVYITTTISFAARRQELYLKRLRSSEARDAEIILAVATPPMLLAIVQIVVITSMSVIGGMPLPVTWWPLAVGLAGGALMCSTIGVLTSSVTRGAENAQITTAPFFFILLAGGVTVMRAAGDASLLQVAIPGGSLAELTRLAWLEDGIPLRSAAEATALLLVWIIGPALVAARSFRWEPRA